MREDATFKRWIEHQMDEVIPQLSSSAMTIQLLPDEEGKIDPAFCLQLGASIMLDKPIVAVAIEGRDIPPKLQMIADEIVTLPDGVSPEGAEQMQTAIERIGKKLDDKGE